ncbi:MAG: ATP-binding protein [Pseudomonadota bacterium]
MLMAAVDGSQDCVKLIGLDGRVLYMNAGGYRLMELDGPAAVVGALWFDFWPASARQRVQQALETACANRHDRFTEVCPTGRGTVKYWDVLLTPLVDDAGAVTVVMVTSRDVSELVMARAEAEASQRAIERHAAALKAVGRIARIGGWEIDVRTSAVHWSNEIWDILGARPRQMDLAEAMSIYAESDRPRVLSLFEQAQSANERIAFEAEVRRFDGAKIPIRVFGEPVYEDGVCVALRGAAQDVTEVVRAKTSLEGAERRLRMALGMSDILVFEVDYRNRRVFSEGPEELFFERGLTYEEMRRDPFGAVDPRDRALAAKAWDVSQQTGTPYRAEYRVARADGREVWASARCRLDCDEYGRPLRLVGALQDITSRTLAERDLIHARDRAEAGSRAKDEFLATVSHEIRTPLNGVLGMAQAMANDELPPAQRRRLDVVRRSGELLLDLLNNVLDLSKIESGRLQLEDAVVNVADLTRRAAEGFGGQLAERDVSLTVSISPEAEGCFTGDAARLSQILLNLVSNAIKFTEQGDISVRLARPDGRLMLEVADTGIGIAPAHLDTIFDRFVQADATTTRRFGGSGLGLAITRELVALMGGSITVESLLGAGSTFRVELPLPPAGDEPMAVPAVAATQEGLPPLRVLAAEDNEVNQLVLRTLLEQVGITPAVVGDGQEAVEAWAAGVWDLILMDIQMPVMDGLAATQEIRRRERESGQSPVPIIALTANVMQDQVREYLAAGMTSVVGKPIQIGELLAAMEQLLSVPETLECS